MCQLDFLLNFGNLTRTDVLDVARPLTHRRDRWFDFAVDSVLGGAYTAIIHFSRCLCVPHEWRESSCHNSKMFYYVPFCFVFFSLTRVCYHTSMLA